MRKCITPTTFANCTYTDGDVKTKPNLAVTPSEMDKLADHGISINNQNAKNFYDGVPNPGWDLAPENARGVDPADLWQAQMSARKKVIAGHKKDKQMYGE